MWIKDILFFEKETKLILKLIVKVNERHTQEKHLLFRKLHFLLLKGF